PPPPPRSRGRRPSRRQTSACVPLTTPASQVQCTCINDTGIVRTFPKPSSRDPIRLFAGIYLPVTTRKRRAMDGLRAPLIGACLALLTAAGAPGGGGGGPEGTGGTGNPAGSGG